MLHVACVKVGTRYGPEYVNTLFDMVRRNLQSGFPGRFVCFTDDASGLDPAIQVRPVQDDLASRGWWAKLYLFSPEAFPEGDRVLYFDLDTAITGPLDKIASYSGRFAILRDVYRPDGMQSSVMAWEVSKATQIIWDSWNRRGRPEIEGGDQAWIESIGIEALRLQDLFPDRFRSFKNECQTMIPQGTSVVFFHGHPRPHEVTTGWVPVVWKVGGGSALEWIVTANTDDQTLRSNVRYALLHAKSWLQSGPENNAPAIIVGGGPSLEEHLFYIHGMQLSGAKVFATNNSYAFLKKHGIQPDAHVLLDAREANLAFVPNDSVPKFYASQCHPSVLFTAGDSLICWHAAFAIYQHLIEHHSTGHIQLGGGTTCGLKAIALAYVLGYRDFRLFGMDSSYREGHHAYAQPLNDGERVVDVSVDGQTFKCAPWMVTQSEEFKTLSVLLTQMGCMLRVYGDGLIPHLAALMQKENADPYKQIDGLWWPSYDSECRRSCLASLPDLQRYIEASRHGTVVQAGGNVGVFAIELAKHFDKVLTFEPDNANFHCLRQNTDEISNITIYHAGLGAKKGSAGIKQVSDNCGAAYLTIEGEIPIITLDSLELEACDLLLLDVEGFEWQALKGARETIERFSPLIVLELKGLGERYGYHDTEVMEWLAELGYEMSGRASRDVIFKRGMYARAA